MYFQGLSFVLSQSKRIRSKVTCISLARHGTNGSRGIPRLHSVRWLMNLYSHLYVLLPAHRTWLSLLPMLIHESEQLESSTEGGSFEILLVLLSPRIRAPHSPFRGVPSITFRTSRVNNPRDLNVVQYSCSVRGTTKMEVSVLFSRVATTRTKERKKKQWAKDKNRYTYTSPNDEVLFVLGTGDEDERFRWTSRKKLVVAERNIHTAGRDRIEESLMCPEASRSFQRLANEIPEDEVHGINQQLNRWFVALQNSTVTILTINIQKNPSPNLRIHENHQKNLSLPNWYTRWNDNCTSYDHEVRKYPARSQNIYASIGRR